MFGLFQEQIDGFDLAAVVFAGTLKFLQAQRPDLEAREQQELQSGADRE